jgi:hypothetical protein
MSFEPDRKDDDIRLHQNLTAFGSVGPDNLSERVRDACKPPDCFRGFLLIWLPPRFAKSRTSRIRGGFIGGQKWLLASRNQAVALDQLNHFQSRYFPKHKVFYLLRNECTDCRGKLFHFASRSPRLGAVTRTEIT